MILFFRILVSLLWQFQVVSIVLNLVLLAIAIYLVLTKKMPAVAFPIGIIMLLTQGLVVWSFLQDINTASATIAFKIFFTYFIFILGLHTKTLFKDSRKIAYLNLILVAVLMLMAVAGIGYQPWGDIKTFAGPYYFKTDLAINVAIALIYGLYFLPFTKWPKVFFVICCLMLIYVSNARIHLLTSFFIITIYLFQKKILANIKRVFIVGLPLILASFILVVFALSTFTSSSDVLTIDFNDFYSDSNLQGRNHIWELLLLKFSDAGITQKTLGMGLTADVKINELFGFTAEANNAHNTYLYILIAMGVLGLLLFIAFSILSFKKMLTHCHSNVNKQQSTILLVFLSQAVLFYISGMSAVTLMFQQQTWFFVFFIGLLYNNNYFKPQKANAV